MFDESELCASMEGLSFKAKAERLAIVNLELDGKVVLTDFLWIVEHVEVHLFAWGK